MTDDDLAFSSLALMAFVTTFLLIIESSSFAQAGGGMGLGERRREEKKTRRDVFVQDYIYILTNIKKKNVELNVCSKLVIDSIKNFYYSKRFLYLLGWVVLIPLTRHTRVHTHPNKLW